MTQKADSKNANAAKLSDTQLAELRKALLAKQSELRAELNQGTAELSLGEDRQPEEMDRVEIANELDDRARRSTRESALLDQVDAALSRFDDGSYGLSEDSGEPIGYDRLKALPWARRTAREEEALERRR